MTPQEAQKLVDLMNAPIPQDLTDRITAHFSEHFMEVRCSNCGGKLEVPADCPSPEQVVCGQCAWQEGR